MRPSWERAFRALSLGPGVGDCSWLPPQMQHQQLEDNGGVGFTGRGSPAPRRWASRQPVRHAPARARPAGCPPARQSAEAAAAAPRGVTAPSQWLCWRRARDCTAGRRRAAREGRPGPPPAAFALREGSLGSRPGVDGEFRWQQAEGKGEGRGGLAAAPRRPRPSAAQPPRKGAAGRWPASRAARGRPARGRAPWGRRSGRGGAGRGRGASPRAGAGLQASVAWRRAAEAEALSTQSREGRPRGGFGRLLERGDRRPRPESLLRPAGSRWRPGLFLAVTPTHSPLGDYRGAFHRRLQIC